MKAPGWYYVPNEPDYVQYFDGERLIPESKRLKEPAPEQKSEATLPAFVTQEAPPAALPQATAVYGGDAATSPSTPAQEPRAQKKGKQEVVKKDRRAPKPVKEPKPGKQPKMQASQLTENYPVHCPRCRDEALAFAIPGKGEILVTHSIIHVFIVTLYTLILLPAFGALGFFVASPSTLQFMPTLPILETTIAVTAGTAFIGLLMLIGVSVSLRKKFPELLFKCKRCHLKF